MTTVIPLGQVVDVSAGQPAPKPDEFSNSGEPFIRAGSLERLISGTGEENCERISEETARQKRLRLYPEDTILFAKSGMSAKLGRVYRLKRPAYVVSHLAALTPIGKYDPNYLSYWLRKNPPSHLIKDDAYPSIRTSEIANLEVPNISLDEQRRIAAILDKADAIRRKRQQALALANDFLKSVFLEMFGDPVSNPFEIDQKLLGKCADFVSGGTPSKRNPTFWNGAFPWVSPKDMKVETILDAQDHVSASVFEETSLKRIPAGTPLIVVRGMILAHTVPMAMAGVEVAINQDMKGILFNEDINPVFGLWCLRVQHQHILDQVDTAAHGTKRLDMDRLKAIPIHVPGDNQQQKFVGIVEKFSEIRKSKQTALNEATDMFSAVSQRAFRGEL